MNIKVLEATIVLPPLHIMIIAIMIIAIVIIIVLVRWSKQLETRRFTIFFYLLISTYITSVYSQGTINELVKVNHTFKVTQKA